MRISLRCRSLVVASILSASLPSIGAAQGFFQNLFGGGSSAPPPMPQQRLPIPNYSHRAPLDLPHRRERDAERSNGDGASTSGRYRTLCVRMCDGYYWPISQSAPRSRFYRDANTCKSSCGEEARLFYLPSSQPDTKDMVDLNGRAYAKLSSAFLYRKRMVDGCKCKPDPWAQSELDRHAMYAETERQEKERIAVANAAQEKVAEPVAGHRAAPTSVKSKTASAVTAAVSASAVAGPEHVTLETDAKPETVETVEAADTQAETEADGSQTKTPPTPAPQRRIRSARRDVTETPRQAQSAQQRAQPTVVRAPQRVAQKGVLAGAAPFGLGAAKQRWPGE